ncbi:protein FAM186A [Dromiciops gliroides]|uniref:protein FAM186A n=1 Tax=Dromiciops gliroides TaxID=33562 RepID=UPI001CC3467F|nr:protein FAM186A [Dromiciops gliroides]
MYVKLHTTKESSESDLESEKSTEIIPHRLQIPDSVKTVICRIEESQLTRAKEDMRIQLDDIMLQVNRIINRYQGDIELNAFRKKKDSSFIEKDFKKNRASTMEEIHHCMHSADVKERILTELLVWLEDWHSILSEATIKEEDERDYYHWISGMDALPDTLSAAELNVNSLIAFSVYFLKDKKRYKKRLASRGTMWKAWREKVLRKPAAGSPMKPEQMIKEEVLTSNKVSEILGMLQELISSNMFNKGEINAIKYIASTAANLHKALGFQNQEIKNLIFQCTTMGSEIKEYYGLEKQTFQRTIQILSDKNEALEKELQDQEEKCMELLQAKANLEHQLSMANLGSNLPSEEAIRKRRNMLLRIQEKIRQEFEEAVSSEESSQIDLPSVPEYLEVPRREPSGKRLARGTAIKWDLSKIRLDSSSDSKSSSSPMSPTSPGKTPVRSSKDVPEDHSRVTSPDSLSPTRATSRTKLQTTRGKPKENPDTVTESKSQESKGEYAPLTDPSKMGRRSELRLEPPERKRRKETRLTQDEEMGSVTKLDERQAERKKHKESSPAGEVVLKTTESPWVEEKDYDDGLSDQIVKQKTTKKGKKEKTVLEANQGNEPQILQDYQKALMSFLQQKIDTLGKRDSKSEFKEQLQPKNPEAQKSLKTVREKMEEYFQKMVETLTSTLKKYREKKPEKPGETAKSLKKGSLAPPPPHSLSTLTEKMDPMLSNMLKALLSQADAVKEEAGERGGRGRRERKEEEDKLDTDLTDDQSFPKNQGMQFIKQLQEERRLWKETQEQIQRKIQEENAWFKRQDEKRRWELKQRQWQAEEELWLEMQQEWLQQEREHEEKRRQWEIEAAQHKMLDPQELERWKEQIAQKYQEQVEFQLRELRRQEEEFRRRDPEKFEEWRKFKQQMEQKQQTQRLSQQLGLQTQETPTPQYLQAPVGEHPSKMMMPSAVEETSSVQDMSDLIEAYLPAQERYDESHESHPPFYPAAVAPVKPSVLESQTGIAPGERPVSTAVSGESPMSRAPTDSGESPVSWSLPTPGETTTSGYPTTSGETPTSGASAPGETPTLGTPVVTGQPPALRPPLTTGQPPALRPPLTTGQPGQPLPSRFPAIPDETIAPTSWATPHFGPPPKLQVPVSHGQPQMSWVPSVSGQLQTSWAPTATGQPQMSWAPAISGHPQISWAPLVPGQPQMSWAPAVSGLPQTSWALLQPQVSWTTVEPQQVSPTPVASGQAQISAWPTTPGQLQVSWDSRQLPTSVTIAAPGEPPTPIALAAPGQPPPYVDLAAPGEPPTSVAFAAPGEAPIPVVLAAPGEAPTTVALAAPGEPSTSVAFAAPGEAPTTVTLAAPGEPPKAVVLAAPGEPPTAVAFAAPGEPPKAVAFAAPGEPPLPVAFAAPGEPPTAVAFAAPGEPPKAVAFAAPGEPPKAVAFAAPGEPPTAVAFAAPGEPPLPVAFAAPGEPPIPVALAAPGETPTPVAPAVSGQPPTPVAPAVLVQPPTPVAPAVLVQPPTPVAPAVLGQPTTPVALATPGLPPKPVALAAPGEPPIPVSPAVPGQSLATWPPAAPEEIYVPQFIASPGQTLVPPGRQSLKPLVPDSLRKSLTTKLPPSFEKFITELAPPISPKPYLGGPPAPKFEAPSFPPTSGKPPTEWSPGILKRTQPYTLEEETSYKTLSPQPSFIAERSFPAVKFPKSPPSPAPAQFLQISQLVSSAHISPKVHLPPIDKKLLTSSSSLDIEKSKVTVPPSSPGDYFVSSPPPEENRYVIDVEGQRKNLAILSRAVESFRLPVMVHHAAKELINETHYSNLIRLGCLFRKYIAYRLIQNARQNIINRIKVIRNSGKGYEAQILYLFLSRIDAYQKKIMEAWTIKQRILEHRRNTCTTKMIDLYRQVQKKFNLKLNYPVSLVIHKKEPEHPLKPVCFKHVVRWPLPEKVEKEKELEIFKKLEKQKDKVESIWRADLSTSSFPIEAKTPMKFLWDQFGGYPDIPRLLELDVRSTFNKSLASIQSSSRRMVLDGFHCLMWPNALEPRTNYSVFENTHSTLPSSDLVWSIVFSFGCYSVEKTLKSWSESRGGQPMMVKDPESVLYEDRLMQLRMFSSE